MEPARSARATSRRRRRPGPDDIFLLVEVADSSLAFDQGAKRIIYARAVIREFWIVDLTADLVHIHRGPVGDIYTVVDKIAPAATLTIEALPGVAIPAEPLFTDTGVGGH